MQHIETVALRRVTQIQHGNIIAIVFFSDWRIAPHQVALRIACYETHAGSTAVFHIGIQEFCGFANARRADHQRMDVTLVHDCRNFIRFPSLPDLAPNDDSLRQIRRVLFPPFFRFECNTPEGFADFLRRGKAGGAMLPIAYRFAFNIQRFPAQNKYHDKERAEQQHKRQQCRNFSWHFEHLLKT